MASFFDRLPGQPPQERPNDPDYYNPFREDDFLTISTKLSKSLARELASRSRSGGAGSISSSVPSQPTYQESPYTGQPQEQPTQMGTAINARKKEMFGDEYFMDGRLSKAEAWKLGIWEGLQVSMVGMGTAAASLAELLGGEEIDEQGLELIRGALVESKNHPGWRDTLREWGENTRRNYSEQLTASNGRMADATTISSLLRMTAQALPLVGVAIGGGAATGAVATAAGAAAVPATIVGALGAAGLVAFPTEKGIIQTELENLGVEAEKADDYSTAGGAVMAALEAAMEGLLAARAVTAVAGRGVTPGVRRAFTAHLAEIAKNTGKDALFEGTTEGLQDAVGTYTVLMASEGRHATLPELTGSFIHSFPAGFGVGGMLSGPISGISQWRTSVYEGRYDDLRTEVGNNLESFDWNTVPIGAEIGEYTHEGDNVWKDSDGDIVEGPSDGAKVEFLTERIATGKTAPMTDEEVATHEARASKFAPNDVPIQTFAEGIAEQGGKYKTRKGPDGKREKNPMFGITPTDVVREVWRTAATPSTRSNARKRALNDSPEDIAHRAAVLEDLALDLTNDLTPMQRIQAMGEKAALDAAMQERRSGGQSHRLDHYQLVNTLLELHQEDSGPQSSYKNFRTTLAASEDPFMKQVLTEVDRALAANLPQESGGTVRELVEKTTRDTLGGVVKGRNVVSEDGTNVGTVQGTTSSGLLTVEWVRDGNIETIHPSEASVIPEVGDIVKLVDGTLHKVKSVAGSLIEFAAKGTADPVISKVSDLGRIVAIAGPKNKAAGTEARKWTKALTDEYNASLPETARRSRGKTKRTKTKTRTAQGTPAKGTTASRRSKRKTSKRKNDNTRRIAKGESPVLPTPEEIVEATVTPEEEAVFNANEVRVPLKGNVSVVNVNTGRKVRVAEIGKTSIKTVSGKILPIAETDITQPGTGATVAEVAANGDIPAFTAGQTPEDGTHINYLVVPEDRIEDFFAAVNSGDPAALSAFIDSNKRGGGLFMLPVPQKEGGGTRMFALQIPTASRQLSKRAKKTLGFLSGKIKKFDYAMVFSPVTLKEDASNANIKVFSVSEGMRSQNDMLRDLKASKLSAAKKREMLKRSLTFNSDVIPEAALVAAQESVRLQAEVNKARHVGDHDTADRLELERQLVNASATMAIQEEAYDATKDAIFTELQTVIGDAITPGNISMLEQLNDAELIDLEAIGGIGKKTAARLEALRAAQENGRFQDVEQFKREVDKLRNAGGIRAIGERKLQAIIDAFPERVRSASEMAQSARDAITELLTKWEGANPNERPLKFTFAHPQIPGLNLIIEKTNVVTRRPAPGQEGLQDVTLPVYHISYRLPNTRVIRSHSISPNNAVFSVPEHFVRETTNGVQNGILYIEQQLAAGVALPDIIADMREQIHQETILLADGFKKPMKRLSDGRVVSPEDWMTIQSQPDLAAEVQRVKDGFTQDYHTKNGEPPSPEQVDRALTEAGLVWTDSGNPDTEQYEPLRIVTEELSAEEQAGLPMYPGDTDTAVDPDDTDAQLAALVTEVEPGNDLIVVEHIATGNRFQVDPAKVGHSTKTRKEAHRTLLVRNNTLTEADILPEVVDEISKFNLKAHILSFGQFYHPQLRDSYAEIRRNTKGGYDLITGVRPKGAYLGPGGYVISTMGTFPTEYDARAAILEAGFVNAPETAWKEMKQAFSRLLPVESLEALPNTPEGDKVWWDLVNNGGNFNAPTYTTLEETYAVLEPILRRYVDSAGFIPPNVEAYAREFLNAWIKKSPHRAAKGLFNRRTRAMLGLETVNDSYARNQRRGVIDVASGATASSITGEDSYRGGTNVQTPIGGEDARTEAGYRYFDILPEPDLTDPNDPMGQEQIEQAQELYKQLQNIDRFLAISENLDISAHTLSDIQHRLVTHNGVLGIMLDVNPGSPQSTILTFPEDGPPKQLNVATEEITKQSKDLATYLRTAQDSLGEIKSWPTTPGMGESPIDAAMSADGVSDKATYSALVADYIDAQFARVKFNKNGDLSKARGVVNALDNIVNAYLRMQEVGIPNSTRTAVVRDKAVQASEDVTVDQETLDSGWMEVYDLLEQEIVELERKIDSAKTAKAREKAERDLRVKTDELYKVVMRGVPEESRPAVEDTKERLIIPRKFKTLVKEEAYKKARQAYSSSSPFGDVIARAKVGMLAPEFVSKILDQARQHGILTANRQTYRVVEDLISFVWNPEAATLVQNLHSEAGVLVLGKGEGLPKTASYTMSLPASPQAITTNTAHAFMMPRTLANRNFTVRLFYQHAVGAMHKWQRRLEYGTDILGNLQALEGSGLSKKSRQARRLAIWGLLENESIAAKHSKPTDILSKDQIQKILGKSMPEELKGWDNWYEVYSEIRKLLNDARRMSIYTSKRRGMSADPVEVTSLDDLTTELAGRGFSDVDIAKIRQRVEDGGTFFDLDTRSQGRNVVPHREIRQFLDLIETYNDISEVPETLTAKLPKWMVDEFNFWAQYGVSNYAPHVLVGRHKIFMRNADGTEVHIGNAPDADIIQQFFFRVRSGEIAGVSKDADLFVKHGDPVYDYDTHYNILGPEAMKDIYSVLSRGMEGKRGKDGRPRAASAYDRIAQIAQLGKDKAVPKNIHMEARTDNMVADTIVDPYKRLIFYWSRVVRSDYLLSVDDAFNLAREQDPWLSAATNTTPIFASKAGHKGVGAVANYMRDLRDSFMGNPTRQDKFMNMLMVRAANFGMMPKSKIEGVTVDPDFEARKIASRVTGYQSVWRLGLNAAGAMINATQNYIFTVPELIKRGDSVTRAYQDMLRGYKDGVKYGTMNIMNRLRGRYTQEQIDENLTDHDREFLRFLDKVGIEMSSAHGASDPGAGFLRGRKPLKMFDDGLGKVFENNMTWASLSMFRGAERLVRVGAASAAFYSAKRRGLDEATSVQYARDIISSTQFQYYNQALPPIMRFNAARIGFQFQPFLWNAIKFEKDMLMGILTGKTDDIGGKPMMSPKGRLTNTRVQSLKAAANYLLLKSTLGGVSSLTMTPMLFPVNFLLSLFGRQSLDELYSLVFGQSEEREKYNFPNQIANPDFMRAENLIHYGVPGLFGVYVSNRIGVGGLDINPKQIMQSVLGPSGALYTESIKALIEFSTLGPNRRARTVGGATAGLVAANTLPPRWRFPYRTLFAPLAGVSLANSALMDMSGESHTTFRDWVRNTPEGRKFVASIVPFRALSLSLRDTMDILDQGHVLNDKMFRQEFTTPLARASYFAERLTGFQRISTEEDRIYRQYLLRKAQSQSATRATYFDLLANAARDHGIYSRQFMSLLNDATQQGLVFDMNSVYERLDREHDPTFKPYTDMLNPYSPERNTGVEADAIIGTIRGLFRNE